MKAVELYYINGKRVNIDTFLKTCAMVLNHFICYATEQWQIAGRSIYIQKIEI